MPIHFPEKNHPQSLERNTREGAALKRSERAPGPDSERLVTHLCVSMETLDSSFVLTLRITQIPGTLLIHLRLQQLTGVPCTHQANEEGIL